MIDTPYGAGGDACSTFSGFAFSRPSFNFFVGFLITPCLYRSKAFFDFRNRVWRIISDNIQDEYQYRKPGVGLIKDVDYSGEYATNPQTRVLTGLTLGAKTAPLELLLLSD
jgi:hypothetical protein